MLENAESLRGGGAHWRRAIDVASPFQAYIDRRGNNGRGNGGTPATSLSFALCIRRPTDFVIVHRLQCRIQRWMRGTGTPRQTPTQGTAGLTTRASATSSASCGF